MVQDSGIGGGITGPDGPMVTCTSRGGGPDATLKKAESLGGKTVSPPMDVPGGPTIAQFKDPLATDRSDEGRLDA